LALLSDQNIPLSYMFYQKNTPHQWWHVRYLVGIDNPWFYLFLTLLLTEQYDKKLTGHHWHAPRLNRRDAPCLMRTNNPTLHHPVTPLKKYDLALNAYTRQ